MEKTLTASAWEIALMLAIFVGLVHWPMLSLVPLPITEVFPAKVVKLASTCSVSLHLPSDLVDSSSTAKEVTVMEASAGRSQRISGMALMTRPYPRHRFRRSCDGGADTTKCRAGRHGPRARKKWKVQLRSKW